MIERVHFQNFKSLRAVELDELKRFILFVGPNASGKSSILEGLHYLAQLGRKKPEELFRGPRDPETLFYRGADHDEKLNIEAYGRWLDDFDAVSCDIERKGQLRPGEASEFEFSVMAREASVTEKLLYGDSPLVDRPHTTALGYEISSALFLRLNPAQLVRPSYSTEETPRVEYDGYGLATVLREMQASQPGDFEQLVMFLKKIIPQVEAVRTRRAPVWEEKTRQITVDGKTFTRQDTEKVMGEEVILDMVGAPGIPAHAASEGTVLTLGLLAVLLNERRPKLLLLDDIEHGLHPVAQAELVGVLREFLELSSDLQILATSHSPYLLDHFEADEIWLTSLTEEGVTAARRLDHHEDFDIWRDEMSSGEFWSYVGEDWVTGGESE